MLEKPDLEDKRIIACLQNQYGLGVVQIDFLPLGADLNTAVYRIVTTGGIPYFCKLRRDRFDEASVAVPKFLSDLGFRQVIPPLRIQTGNLWAELDPFKVILYPFVEGYDGFKVNLSDQHWVEFGKALKSFHSAVIPPSIARGVPRETYSPKWREIVRSFLARLEGEAFTEPVAGELAAFLKTKYAETQKLVARTERLAVTLQSQNPKSILCHADIHVGNLLIGPKDELYLVDWDTLIFAPKERDLMFIGGGLGGGGHTPQEEISLFYQGYGQTQIDPIALAYYRCERIIEDIAVICEQVFLSEQGGQDRLQAIEYLKSNYLPEGTIELAYLSDITKL